MRTCQCADGCGRVLRNPLAKRHPECQYAEQRAKRCAWESAATIEAALEAARAERIARRRTA